MNAVNQNKARLFHAYNLAAVSRGWPLLSVHSASKAQFIEAASRIKNKIVAKELIKLADNIES